MSEFSFEIRADYVLLSDPNTPVTKSLKHTLQIVAPFEANYEFHPRIHPDPWPSYFNIKTIHTESTKPQGLKQKWLAMAKIVSFANEAITINTVTLKILDTKHDLLYSLTTTTPISSTGLNILPNDLYEHHLYLEIQKPSLEDHRHATLTFDLEIAWERSSPFPAAIPTINTLLVPPLTIPFGEPRLVATSSASIQDSSLIHMTYTLENPSMHALTFSLTMEASEEFAFSGPKSTTTQLLPLSRKDIKYNISPTKQGVWIRPSFKCVDVGFGKLLRCMAGEGCRVDRQRGLVVWAQAE